MFKKRLHRIKHRFGWFSGNVISGTTETGHVWVAFKCDECGEVTGRHLVDERLFPESSRVKVAPKAVINRNPPDMSGWGDGYENAFPSEPLYERSKPIWKMALDNQREQMRLLKQWREEEAMSKELALALTQYVSAQGRMLDNWAEYDEAGRGYLWRKLHECEDGGRAVLEKYNEKCNTKME